MWWETYNISWIFCDHLKSSPYHHPISTVQVELVDEKAGSVYTVSFHQMILFGFSRFCVNLCIILFGFFELVIFAKLHFASQGARLRPLQILGWQSIWKVRASHFKKQVGNLSENKPNLSSLVHMDQSQLGSWGGIQTHTWWRRNQMEAQKFWPMFSSVFWLLTGMLLSKMIS